MTPTQAEIEAALKWVDEEKERPGPCVMWDGQYCWDKAKVLAEAYRQLLKRVEKAEQEEGVLKEAAIWALEMLEARDVMNAKVHCAPVRYSPIVDRLRLALGKSALSEAEKK